MTVTHESSALREAARIADEVLFPAALAVEAVNEIPRSHLDLLAEKGFYGLAARGPLATLDLSDFPSVSRVVEIIAGGCLTTAFVWLQHHGSVMAMTDTGNEALREEFLPQLISGRRRGGLAIGAAVRPGPPLLRAKATEGGYIFSGEAPWVTGWGMVDLLYTAGRDGDDMLVWALLDAVEGDTLTVEPLDMVAVQASRTVTLRFHQHFVPNERVSAVVPHAVWLERDPESARFNGALALGVAQRAVTMMGEPASLAREVEAVRAMLAAAEPDRIAAVRAAGSELALRAAAALAVHEGSRSVLLGAHAQRLIREATFLLVFASRPGIRSALLDMLTRPRHTV